MKERKDQGRGMTGTKKESVGIFSTRVMERQADAGNWINGILVFLFALFFIIAVSSPGLFLNDEWITANQLHQLDLGHQVTINEGKYGSTANGTISYYFIARGNILLYSLALPIASLPVAKIFGIFSDNFRLAVILFWSLIPVIAALLIERCNPRFSRIRGIRLSFIALFLWMILFCANVLLYKQFPYSAPDAPYEVAALVMTNHILFALIAAVIFEISQLIFRDLRISVFSTFAVISCSTYMVWTGTGKDHILTSAIFALILLFLVRYLYAARWWDATAAFICSGLLLWVRPEVGLVVSAMLILFFIGNAAYDLAGKHGGLKELVTALVPIAGTGLGAVPFFLNNLLLTGSFFTPVWRAEGLAVPIMTTTQQVSEAVSSAATQAVVTAQPGATYASIFRVVQSRFSPLSLDMLGHLVHVLTFPRNHGFGFFIICPLLPLALLSLIFWYDGVKKIRNTDRKVLIFLIVMSLAIICSYIPEMGVLDTNTGTPPDMRYLMPAYISAGLLSIMILRQTPLLKDAGGILKKTLYATAILTPLFIIIMIVIHPFGVRYAGYAAVFLYFVLFGIVLCFMGMVLTRLRIGNAGDFSAILPIFLLVTIVAVFTFQIVVAFVMGDVLKFNGYPFWLPLIRDGYGLIFKISVMQPG